MNKQLLKQLRFLVPGLIFYAFHLFFGYITGLWAVHLPENWQEAAFSTTPLILAFLYYSLPIRNFSNKDFYEKINENIVKGILEISGPTHINKKYTWKKISPIFYHFIDKDPSLKSKSLDAYFNGLIWTTWADVRAISFFYIILSSALAYFSCPAGAYSVFFFAIIFLTSFLGSHFVTKRHLSIGEEQLDVIRTLYRNELQDLMAGLDD